MGFRVNRSEKLCSLEVKVDKNDVSKTDVINLRSLVDAVELRLDRLEKLCSEVTQGSEQCCDRCDKALAFLSFKVNEDLTKLKMDSLAAGTIMTNSIAAKQRRRRDNSGSPPTSP